MIRALAVAALVLLPVAAHGVEVAGLAPPGSGATVGDLSWPAALVAVAVALSRAQLPALVVRVVVEHPTPNSAPPSA